MDIEIGTQRRDEFDAVIDTLSTAFTQRRRAAEAEAIRLVHEDDRTLVAREERRIVGVAAAVTLDMTVPGGSVPTAGVTSVGVLPTHRRRGILSALMRRQLDDIRDRGEPVAALYTSEAPIYGRYGYGLGSSMSVIRIEREHNAFRDAPPPQQALTLLSREEALRQLPAIYDRAVPRRPGLLRRDARWWEWRIRDIEIEPEGFGPPMFVVSRGPDGADGYAIYRTKTDWSRGFANGTLEVVELVDTGPAPYAALWRYLLDVDLIARVEAWLRPVDEPLPHLLRDPRRLELGWRDALWIRLVDVGVALATRRYAVEGRVVIGVRDATCPWNETRFLLTAAPDGAECTETDLSPEIVLGVDDLAAVYLGGIRLRSVAAAGRVDEDSQGALDRADQLFAWPVAPWTAHLF